MTRSLSFWLKRRNINTPALLLLLSLTCIISKILENSDYSNICRHLDSENIITPRQHEPGLSCESELILAVEHWAKAVDSLKQVDVAILDFSIAFGIEPHEHLKSKLRFYEICGNNFN